MSKIHSHYDNLTVSRNASPDVIRAAYRVLCQKYHPDKHNQDPKYVHIMSIINTSYHVLMDPEQRLKHDIWLAEQEEKLKNTRQNDNSSDKKEKSFNDYKQPFQKKQNRNTSSFKVDRTEEKTYERNFVRVALAIIILPIVISIIYSFSPNKRNTASAKQYQYVRKNYAPNGFVWPRNAGYLTGYAIENNDGLSNITIKNEQGSSDIYLKLATIDGYTIRHVYIPKGQSFKIQHVNPGAYILKYKQLDNGQIYKADNILQIDEIRTYYGTQFTNLEFTIYPVTHGNTTKTRLNENEF